MKESRRILASSKRRYDELDVLIQRTYEDHVEGKLTDKRFMKLSSGMKRSRSIWRTI